MIGKTKAVLFLACIVLQPNFAMADSKTVTKNNSDISSSFKLLYDSSVNRVAQTITVKNRGPDSVMVITKNPGCVMQTLPSGCTAFTDWCDPSHISPNARLTVTGTEIAIGLRGIVLAMCLNSAGKPWSHAIDDDTARVNYDCSGSYCR